MTNMSFISNIKWCTSNLTSHQLQPIVCGSIETEMCIYKYSMYMCHQQDIYSRTYHIHRQPTWAHTNTHTSYTARHMSNIQHQLDLNNDMCGNAPTLTANTTLSLTAPPTAPGSVVNMHYTHIVHFIHCAPKLIQKHSYQLNTATKCCQQQNSVAVL